MKLSQLGEFGLIDLIKNSQKNSRKDTILGIGDDCAVLKLGNRNWKIENQLPVSSSNFLLVTTDTLIEGIHFDLKHLSFFDLGYKAMLVNISDIAAMGGVPTHALVTIGVPGNIQVEKLKQFQRGLNKLAKKYKIDIIGGDTVSSPKAIMVSITLLGEVEKNNLLTRSNARVGDAILVTGEFGLPASRGYKVNRHPLRLSEARRIARSRLANSMIDSSDGLARSVLEICKYSRVGARIFADKVPCAKDATLDNALYGGEDYELIFTAPAKRVMRLQKVLKCKVVGKIVSKGKGIKLIDSKGWEKKLEKGYQHFS